MPKCTSENYGDCVRQLLKTVIFRFKNYVDDYGNAIFTEKL